MTIEDLIIYGKQFLHTVEVNLLLSRVTSYDTLDLIDELHSGKKYDAILLSNSIWLSMLDSNIVHTSNLRSTSITPIKASFSSTT